MSLDIRPATPADEAAIWDIIGPVIRAGETYALPRDLTRDAALNYWLGNDRETFVAVEAGQVLGTYYIRANQPGGGSHIANCGYMTAAAATGRGIARQMCLHSLEHARQRGYKGMQFNFVVSTNERAIRLWRSLGFDVLARLPLAFRHPRHGFVDALIMFKAL